MKVDSNLIMKIRKQGVCFILTLFINDKSSFNTHLIITVHIHPALPLPSLVLAFRSGGAGAAGGAAGVGAAAGAGADEVAALVSAPPSVPATTMFSTAAATLAAARAALAVAQPYRGTGNRIRDSNAQTHKSTATHFLAIAQNYNTLRGLFVLNSLHLAIIKVIIFDTAILGFFAAINGLWTFNLQYVTYIQNSIYQ